jgi:hypothetical protein
MRLLYFSGTLKAKGDSMVKEHKMHRSMKAHEGGAGFFFLLAYIGAAIYFIQQSNGGFWEVILGLLQAAIWPVYVIFHVLTALGA